VSAENFQKEGYWEKQDQKVAPLSLPLLY